eukprot:gene11048-3321_t
MGQSQPTATKAKETPQRGRDFSYGEALIYSARSFIKGLPQLIAFERLYSSEGGKGAKGESCVCTCFPCEDRCTMIFACVDASLNLYMEELTKEQLTSL